MINASDIFPNIILIKTRLKPLDILRAVHQIRIVLRGVHKFNVAELAHDFRRAFIRMESTTMVATGHLQEQAFQDRRRVQNGTSFRMGYGPTKNNESVAQEFDDGPVHKRVSQHQRSRCSTIPQNIFAQYGFVYKANPKARRRAMAKSIEEIFNTSVRYAAIHGGDYYYKPNLSSYVRGMSARTARYLKTIGVT